MAKRSKHKRLHNLADRSDWLCHYCLRRVRCAVCAPDSWYRAATRDHVLPRAHGGRGDGNFVLACWQCNQEKGSNPEWRRNG